MIKVRKAMKVALFCAIGTIFLFITQDIFIQKFNYPIHNDGITRGMKGAYSSSKESLDVIYLGTSHASSGISPMDMYKIYGISSYNLGTSVQPIEMSYWLLKDVLKNQSPKVVVIDASSLFFAAPNVAWRYMLDSMPLSVNKLYAINDYEKYVDNSDNALSLIFPLLKYHSRWNAIKSIDFLEMNCKDTDYTKGYIMRVQKNASKSTVDMMNAYNQELTENREIETVIYGRELGEFRESSKLRNTEISEHNLEYLLKIQKLCKENNIELLLTKVPNSVSPNTYSSAWTRDRYELLVEVCSKYKIKYHDLLYDDILDMDWDKDSVDGGIHLNYLGAKKVTMALGRYLVETYELEKKKNDEFEQDMEIYEEIAQVAMLQCEDELSTYIDMLDGFMEKYVVSFAAFGECFEGLTEIEKKKLQELGLETDFSKAYRKSFVAIFDSGEKIYESNSDRAIFYQYVAEDEKIFSLYSSGYYIDPDVSIKIEDDEYACDLTGLNIVIYDKASGKVVDSVVFDTNQEDHPAQRYNNQQETLFREYEYWNIHENK